MKNKFTLIIMALCVLALLLTSCSGATETATSWGGATVTDSSVLFANGSLVYALRTDNGNTIWSYPTGKAVAGRMFLAAPVVAGEQVLVGDYTFLLTSLDIKNGNENWQFSEAKGKYIDSPLVVGETIVAPNADNSLYALDLKGNKLWAFSAEQAFWAQPVSDGETVFAPNMDHNMYAVDLTTGKQVWKTDLKASLVARPLLLEGVIYVGNLDGDFFAVDSKKGTILWETKVSGGVWSAPTNVLGRLLFGSQTGNIYVLKAETGSIIYTIETGSAVLGSGAVIKDGVVFGLENGDLKLIGLDGSEDWTRTVGGALYSNISINGNLFVVVANKGDNPLVAFDTEGKQSWYFTPKK